MSFNKAILHHKEHRKPFTKSKAIDPSCRCHGGCPFCQGNRLHSTNVKMESLQDQEKEFADLIK